MPEASRGLLRSLGPTTVYSAAMTSDACYQPDLAWVHHTGYSQYVEQACAGIVRLLRAAGLSAGTVYSTSAAAAVGWPVSY